MNWTATEALVSAVIVPPVSVVLCQSQSQWLVLLHCGQYCWTPALLSGWIQICLLRIY